MAYVVQLNQPKQVEVRDYRTPEPWPGDSRVRTLYSGISAGTELATYRGTNPYLEKRWDPDAGLFLPGQATFSYPVDAWGCSEVGVVEVVGSEVTDVSVDDVVWGIWGHRSHAVLPRLAGHQLPEGLDPLVGTFDRVGAVALNAVLASGACVGERVAIFGLGVIGLLTTQLLIAQGDAVLAVDTMPHRLKLAEQFGATSFPAQQGDLALLMRERCAGHAPDRVIELTGAYPALHQAIRVAGVGGTVVAAGFYQGPATALDLGEEFHNNRVTVVSSQISAIPPALSSRWTRERLHETVIKLCAAGRIDPLPLVSHVMSARDAAEAYRLIDDPPADLLQVVLDFRSESE